VLSGLVYQTQGLEACLWWSAGFKVSDIAEIMSFGIMSAPGVVVDGTVVHRGGIPGPDLVWAWIRD